MSYPTTGLLALWKFDEFVDGKLLNLDGSSHYDYTTVQGKFVAGYFNNALELSPSEKCTFTPPASIPRWTYAGFINTSPTSNFPHIFTAESNQNRFALKYAEGGFGFYFFSNSTGSLQFDLQPVADTWVFFAVRFDGSTMEAQVDGTWGTSHSVPSAVGTIPAHPMAIGEAMSGEGNTIRHDATWLYNRALSNTELDDLRTLTEILPPPPEETVDAITITALTDTTAEIEWDATGNTDDYQVEVLWGGTVEQTHIVVNPAIALDTLPAATEITLRITPRNESGDGTATDNTFTTPDTAAPTDAPAGVSIETIAQGFALTWDWVINADDYVVRVKTPTGADLGIEQTTTDTADTVTGLDFNTRYLVEITARNAEGEGPAYSETLATSILRSGADVALALIDTSRDARVAPIVDPDALLAGVVEDIEGNPLKGYSVFVYDRLTGELQKTATSDSAGQWQWQEIDTTREYFVVAINPASDAQDYTPPAANRLEPVTPNTS